MKVFACLKGQRIKCFDKISKPAFVLSNHTSFYDFLYTTTAIYPHRINYLAADKMFYDPVLGKVLRLARAIPKCLFQQDLLAVRSTKQIIEQKGIVGIFPEGQISAIGKTNLPPFVISKLIKKQAIDVFIVKHHNAYFVNPPWSKRSFRGRIDTTVEKILTKEMIMTMNESQIFDMIKEKLDYHADSYNDVHRYRYHVKPIDNLENLVYHCPKCGTDGLVSNKNTLCCLKCGLILKYNSFGRFDDYTISELYFKQQSVIEKQIEEDPNFTLSGKVVLESYRNNRVERVGKGFLTITKDAYTYSGTIDNLETTKTFLTTHVPYLPSDIGINIQIYQDYQLYQFVFEDKHLATKFVIAGEYCYKLHHK
ncbi:MAG TPA: lysophospholipid acyltransferase family protein [Candidatus Paceibacterota bacterium]|nr:1-acyl-sn-glycerol-3-phosphate acyltransferase [Sedimentibacter sp.]HOE15598.1 lysophospholipid acyltransferase family protein [Candidatus Paceibacterota bacterium]